MRRSNVEAVIFDLGGVLIQLCDDAVRQELRRLGASVTLEGGQQWIQNHADYNALNLGRLDGDTFLRRLRDALLPEADLATVRRLWVARLGPSVPGMAELVSRLAQRARLAMFSNTDEIHWAAVMAGDYAFLAHFDRVYASHLLGRAKPDRQAYQAVLDDLGLAARQCVFIDDSDANVRGARAVGMDGILFTTVPRLQEDLARRGLVG